LLANLQPLISTSALARRTDFRKSLFDACLIHARYRLIFSADDSDTIQQSVIEIARPLFSSDYNKSRRSANFLERVGLNPLFGRRVKDMVCSELTGKARWCSANQQ